MIYSSHLYQTFPLFYKAHIKLKPEPFNILSSGEVSIEKIVLDWVNKILELQYKDYEDFISDNSTRPKSFKSISKKVKIEISQGRRTAILLPEED